MNRRSFLGGLLKGALIASVAPQIIVNCSFKWKLNNSNLIWTRQQVELYQKLPFYLIKMEMKNTLPPELFDKVYKNIIPKTVPKIPLPDYITIID